jgi:hypothetical protein
MKYQHSKLFEYTVSTTINLYEILRSMGIRDHTGEWLNFLHWNRTMTKEQKIARTLMDEIVKMTTEYNEQISERLVYERILYGLIQKVIYFRNDYPDFPSSAKGEISIF